MAPEKRFITQEDEQSESLWSQVCSVDCTHPHALTLTHHKTHRNPNDIDPADTSTGKCESKHRPETSSSTP